MNTKTCTKCNVEQPMEQFQKASRNKDGYQLQCKICTSAATKLRRAKAKNKNLINGFAGKVCRQCGGTRFHASGKCSACAKKQWDRWLAENKDKRNQQAAKYRSENKEKSEAATLKWRSNNPEKVRSTSRAYLEANKERAAKRASEYGKKNRRKISEQQKQYRESNKTKVRARIAAYNLKNKEKRNAARREWHRLNPDAALRYRSSRRARKQNCEGRLSIGIRQKLYELQRGLCACCKQPLGKNYHLDHIIPLSLGGPNTDNNVQLLRAECNLRKRAKDPIDYMQSKGFLL